MNRTEKIKNRIDFKALTTTLSIQTKYSNDDAMLLFIKEKLSTLNVVVQEDDYGNIYVTKGKAKVYPCIVAHTDTVHDILPDINIFRTGDTLFAFNPEKRCQWGIGGDDKVGVYITLQLLEDMPKMKAVFFRDEEIGCLGSHYSIESHKDWYSDCGFVLQADRRGNDDIITVAAGIILSDKDFLSTCDPLFEKYEYKDAVGINTDVCALTEGGIGICTLNLSCGYHDPHSRQEIVSIEDVNRCYNLMYDIITEHGDKVFKYEANIPVYKSSYKKAGKTVNDYMSEIIKTGASTPVTTKRQIKLFPSSVLGESKNVYDLFTEVDIIKSSTKVYAYCGIKALPLTGGGTCTKCKEPILDNMYYMPYEGRIYCTKCNDYVAEYKIPDLLQHLEVDDKGTTFVYSLYSNGWLKKKDAMWSQKFASWMSTQLPF